MAPPAGSKRGVKRAANDATRPTKAAKESSVDPSMAAVVEALELSVELPVRCKSMLMSMLPFSLGTPAEARGPNTDRVVEMIRQSLADTRLRLQAAFERDEEMLSEITSSKAQLIADVCSAEAAVAETSQLVVAKKGAVKEAEATAKAALSPSRAAAEAARVGGVAAEQATAEQRKVQEALEVHLVALMNADDWNPDYSCQHRRALIQAVKQLKDAEGESFIQSVESSIEKAPSQRGTFDGMVIEQVRKGLVERVAQLKEIEHAETEKKNELDAAAIAAEAAFNVTQDAVMVVSTEEGEAEQQKMEAMHRLRTAKALEASFLPNVTKATLLRDEAEASVKRFREHNMACFEKLANTAPVESAALAPEPMVADSEPVAIEAAPESERKADA